MKHLRELRKARNLTQKEIADLLNIPRSTYNRYERNQSQADYNTLIKLSNIFDVSINYIIDDNYTEPKIKNQKKLQKIYSDFTEYMKETLNPQIKINTQNNFNKPIINNFTINSNNSSEETDDKDDKIHN